MNQITIEDVKAKDFFKCVRFGSSEYLNCENSDQVFKDLQDEFFLARDNGEDKSDLNTHKNIANLTYKLSVLELIKEVYQGLPLDQPRRERVEKSISELGYKFDFDGKDAKDINNQFVSWIGQVKNQIKIAELNLLNKGERDGNFQYSQVIVAFEAVIERPISEDISLSKFCAYERESNLKIKKLKKQNNG